MWLLMLMNVFSLVLSFSFKEIFRSWGLIIVTFKSTYILDKYILS